jgi:predicted transcriptional regulator
MSDSNEKVVLTENDNVSREKEIRLVDVVVSDENVALNLMVSFLSLAHKRGSFGLDESAKIWECVQMFQK